jgi:hypothetical protein
MATAYNYANYNYTDDAGKKHPMRLSSITAAAQPTAAVKSSAAAPDLRDSVRRGPTAKKRGIHARGIRLVRTAGTAPDIKAYYDTLPILLPADLATALALTSITIGANAWTPITSFAEFRK